VDRAGEKAFKTVTHQPNLPGSVRILDVAGESYRRAFELFMTGTDEKVVTHDYLKTLVEPSAPCDRRFGAHVPTLPC
jgi:hypothetical protein